MARAPRRRALDIAARELLRERAVLVSYDRVGVALGNGRPAEGPARARGHVDPHAEPRGLAHRVIEHGEPFRRKVGDEAVLAPLHPVDGNHGHAAQAGGAQGLEIPGDVVPVHGAARPPPVAAGAVFRGRLGPIECPVPDERASRGEEEIDEQDRERSHDEGIINQTYAVFQGLYSFTIRRTSSISKPCCLPSFPTPSSSGTLGGKPRCSMR